MLISASGPVCQYDIEDEESFWSYPDLGKKISSHKLTTNYKANWLVVDYFNKIRLMFCACVYKVDPNPIPENKSDDHLTSTNGMSK